MMEFVTNIEASEFDAFALQCESNHYTKTSMYGRFKAVEGYEYVLVGVRENGRLVASAMVLRKRIPYLLSWYCYVPYGYNMDYDNAALLTFMNRHLSEYARKILKACFLRIDPNVCRREHFKNGQVNPDGFNNEWLTKQLMDEGFTHLGYNYGYSGNWMSRYTYLLDLSQNIETIRKNIKNFNSHINKNAMREIVVREKTEQELVVLYKTQLELAEKERFIPKSLEFFQAFYRAFEGNAHLYVAETDLGRAYQNLVREKKSMEEQLSIMVNENKIRQQKAGIEALAKEIAAMEVKEYDKQGTIVLGAKLILQLKDKVFNVYMYTHKLLPNFRTALALHAKALEDSKARHATSYDFEGVSGSLDPKDSYYGLHDFKRSFGGDFLEFVGEFDYIIDPIRYRLFRRLDRLYRRVRRKLYLQYKGWQ